jgi:hypothetical protein
MSEPARPRFTTGVYGHALPAGSLPATDRLDQLIDDRFTSPASLTTAFGGSGGTR